MKTKNQKPTTETPSSQGGVIGGDRYFLYVGENDKKLFNLNLETNKIYHKNTLTHEKYTLLDYINFSLENGFEVDDFIELNNINSSIGSLILSLKDICNEFGLKCEVKIFQ